MVLKTFLEITFISVQNVFEWEPHNGHFEYDADQRLQIGNTNTV